MIDMYLTSTDRRGNTFDLFPNPEGDDSLTGRIAQDMLKRFPEEAHGILSEYSMDAFLGDREVGWWNMYIAAGVRMPEPMRSELIEYLRTETSWPEEYIAEAIRDEEKLCSSVPLASGVADF